MNGRLAEIAADHDKRAVAVDRLAAESDGIIAEQQREIAAAHREAARRCRLTVEGGAARVIDLWQLTRFPSCFEYARVVLDDRRS